MWLLFVAKWTGIVWVASLLGIWLVLAWDWFFYTRLPYALWKASQHPDDETRVLREIVRMHRLWTEEEPPDDESPDGPC